MPLTKMVETTSLERELGVRYLESNWKVGDACRSTLVFA